VNAPLPASVPAAPPAPRRGLRLAAARLAGQLRSAEPLILDEAHNAAPASGARYAIDSQFTKSIRELAPRFEHRLFLSATPHNGHSNSLGWLDRYLGPVQAR
jgi:superfamily II DNA or RNA helicase